MREQRRKIDHAHNLKDSSHSEKHLSDMHHEPRHLHYNTHDYYDEKFTLDKIDACIAKINALEVVGVDAP